METYERLQEILDSHPTGAPKSAAFDEILRILFTPEEAALAVQMSFGVGQVAAAAQVLDLDLLPDVPEHAFPSAAMDTSRAVSARRPSVPLHRSTTCSP